jgi:hypothetical protein
MGGAIAMIGGAAWLAVIALVLAMFSGAVVALALACAVAAAALVVRGVRRALRVAGTPRTAVFDGQVIARWSESDGDGGTDYHIAVDDGAIAWTFSGPRIFNLVAIGDMVRVQVNPRSGSLTDLTVTGSPRKEQQPRRQPLLTSAEAASVTGPAKPGGLAGPVIFQGSRGNLTLVLMDGKIADWNARHARRHGIPLPGIGDGAWVRNSGRVAVVAVGDHVAKLLLSGGAMRQNLPALASLVASRLAGQTRRADEIRAPGPP